MLKYWPTFVDTFRRDDTQYNKQYYSAYFNHAPTLCTYYTKWNAHYSSHM